MVQKKNLSFPDRKISETFLDFAAPLCVNVENQEQIEEILKIAFVIWNSVVLDTLNGNHEQVALLRQTAAQDPIVAAISEQMITRKETLYADDQRLIGDFKFILRNDVWYLRVETRVPIGDPE